MQGGTIALTASGLSPAVIYASCVLIDVTIIKALVESLSGEIHFVCNPIWSTLHLRTRRGWVLRARAENGVAG